jgi:hypothetical protein
VVCLDDWGLPLFVGGSAFARLRLSGRLYCVLIQRNRKVRMSHNFYVGPGASVVAGSANFAALIATGFASYGLTTGQATAFGTLNTALQSAYSAAIEPTTRTRVTIAAKTLALRNMRVNAVLLAKIVYATPTVTDGQLVALGLLPRSSRTPIGPPTTAPIVEVGVVSGRLVNLRLHSSDSERRGIEAGAKGVNLYSYVGATPPADPRDYHFEGMATRTITQILFPDSVAGGATVWLSARWVSARGATGPASTPVNFTMQGGAVLPEAA